MVSEGSSFDVWRNNSQPIYMTEQLDPVDEPSEEGGWGGAASVDRNPFIFSYMTPIKCQKLGGWGLFGGERWVVKTSRTRGSFGINSVSIRWKLLLVIQLYRNGWNALVGWEEQILCHPWREEPQSINYITITSIKFYIKGWCSVAHINVYLNWFNWMFNSMI